MPKKWLMILGVLALAVGLVSLGIAFGEEDSAQSGVSASPDTPAWSRWGRAFPGFPGQYRDLVGDGGLSDGSEIRLLELKRASLRSAAETAERSPPLSPSGPGAAKEFYAPLGEFRFPEEDALWQHLGFETGGRTKKAFAELEQAMVGKSSDRRALSRRCRRELRDEEKKNGHLKAAPSPQNLICYFERMKRLSADYQAEIRSREAAAAKLLEESRKPAKGPKRYPRRLVSSGDWKRLEGLPYVRAISVVSPKGRKEALRFAKAALEGQNLCASSGARSGLLRGLEDHLPDEEIYEAMVALYAVQKECLQPSDDSFEEIHFRMGLLALERGKLSEAGTSFSYALEDLEGRDEYRVLFWRGLLEAFRSPRDSSGEPNPVGLNPFWVRLIQKYPLTFHALVADSITGYELHTRLLERPDPWVALYQGTEWNAHNAASFLFALSISRKNTRMMEVMGRHVIQSLDPISLEQGLYFGLAQLEAGFVRGAIKALYVASSRYGTSEMSLTVLDKLYPRLYVEDLKEHGGGVDLALALSLMRQESSFNPQAASAAKAKGLMQVLPGTARMMLRKQHFNLFDPVTNIKAGTKYLDHLLGRYEDNYVHTLASYNAGPGKVAAWKGRYLTTDPLLFADLIPYRETRNYVAGLLRNIHWYRVLINGDEHHELISSTDTSTWTARSLIPDPLQWGIESLEEPVNLVFEEVPDFGGVGASAP